MTEAEAERSVGDLVGEDAVACLTRLRQLVIDENQRQNLIAASTIEAIWSRHILDSVQLCAHAPADGAWLDIGTGGGFPGLAVAAAQPERVVTLVEPRRKRADFLARCAIDLGLLRVTVIQKRIEAAALTASIVSARAVAPLGKLLQAARHCATPSTRWLLLRGELTDIDRDEMRRQRQMTFHVEQSITDEASSIIVGDGAPR